MYTLIHDSCRLNACISNAARRRTASGVKDSSYASFKLAFHDTDIDTDILARILARKSRVSDVMIGVSGESVSWNLGLIRGVAEFVRVSVDGVPALQKEKCLFYQTWYTHRPWHDPGIQ